MGIYVKVHPTLATRGNTQNMLVDSVGEPLSRGSAGAVCP